VPSRIGLALSRLRGLVHGDGARDSALYFEDTHTVVADLVGRDPGVAAFLVRGLDARNAPTELFRVNKDGTGTWTSAATFVNVKLYGATGDGTTDDRAAVLAAEASLGAAGGTLYFPPGTYRLGSSTTLLGATNLLFPGGSTVAPAAGTTLTVGGTVQAGLYAVFSGTGTVVVARSQPVFPEWWGALADVKSAQTGAAMTAGSAALTTGGLPPLAAADVGKPAVVVGAGTGGAPLLTTVAAVTDASHATLADAAATAVSSNRWALGSDSTTALNACMAAAGGLRGVCCPVLLSGLYGTGGVLLQAGQVVRGAHIENTGFYRLAAGAGAATVALAPGVSGDALVLAGFLVNNLFLGTYDGIEIGTAAGPLALASGGTLRDLKVRNAAAWGFDVRANVAALHNLWSQHDQAPPPGNTTAGGVRLIDTLVYASALSVEGYSPAGAFYLGAGAGSVYDGLQMEPTGAYPAADLVTIAGNQQTLRGVFVGGTFTHRDLIRIAAGFQDVDVTLIRVIGTYTLTNVLNDVDRGAAIPATGADYAYGRYWTTNATGPQSHDGGGGWKVRKTVAPTLVLSDANAFSSGTTRTVALRGEAVNPAAAYRVAGGLRLGLTPITGRSNLDTEVVLETQDSLAGALFDALTADKMGNVVVGTGALATSAVDRFLYLPTCPGTPTGVPTAKTGRVPLVYDATNGVLSVFNGTAWVAVVDQAAWTAFTPSWTGFSATPTVVSRYKQLGKTVVWAVGVTGNGTSNGTTLLATLPVAARASQTGVGMATCVDNAAFLTTPGRIDLPNTTQIQVYTTLAAGVWTGSGAKSVSFTLVYEAA